MSEASRARLVLTKGPLHFEIEGSEEFVTEKLNRLLPLSNSLKGIDLEPEDENDERAEDDKADGAKTSMRGFLEDKKPRNASEAIACVLFFHQKTHGRDELSTAEIRTALIAARYRPPANMPQAVTDCRRKYGFINAGTKKGLWALSHDGEVAVNIDLPHSTK